MICYPRALIIATVLVSTALGVSSVGAQPATSGRAAAYQERLERLVALSEGELLDIIAKTAPTIRDAMVLDAILKKELGGPVYKNALAQVALLTRSKDRECSQALRIIGDTVPRTNAPVGRIKLDGQPHEWRSALPTPQTRRWHELTEDRAREVFKHGVAAVVRENRLYLLAGIEDPNYFNTPHNRLRIKIDRVDGPEWDVAIYVAHQNGSWTGRCDFIPREGEPKRPSIKIEGIEAAVEKVAEIALQIVNFASPPVAKPIWTLYLNARTVVGDKIYHPRTRVIPVFNESAPPGVAATPYVRNLIYLAADVGLQESDRTAAAIAITSATAYATSDDDVRRQLRRDNAELLRLARQIVAWQRARNTDYRLDRYPLEAQLAWANRCIWLGVKYLSWNRTRDAHNDLDNYRWAFTDIETLRELSELARNEGLVDETAPGTAKHIDEWVTGKLVRRPWVHHLPRAMEQYKDNPKKVAVLRKQYEELLRLRESGAVTTGRFKGETVYQVFARNTATYLSLIRDRGCFYGGCPDEAWVGQDLLRAVGLAPMAFGVAPARGQQTGHCWAGYYDPKRRTWRSAQIGRSGGVWWLFNLDRIAVYPYAAMAPGLREDREMPLPLFYRRELQGREVKNLTQRGIPTRDVRRWMLTPCW